MQNVTEHCNWWNLGSYQSRGCHRAYLVIFLHSGLYFINKKRRQKHLQPDRGLPSASYFLLLIIWKKLTFKRTILVVMKLQVRGLHHSRYFQWLFSPRMTQLTNGKAEPSSPEWILNYFISSARLVPCRSPHHPFHEVGNSTGHVT
jgi:hypothetical protein